ncbi:MAG: STAS domain-containing protein [Gammaproteobacteria bacterium]|nr:STAS domain-containing protein [Gammaproteobacteria bacterium]
MSASNDTMISDMLAEPGDATRLEFSDELTIYGAAQLQARFSDALSLGHDIELDFSAVSELDCAGVQLLMLIERECRALNRALRITARSAVSEEVFTLLNLRQFLPLAAAA